MARKNLIEVSLSNNELTSPTSNSDIAQTRPLAGFVPAKRTGPVGGISKSLGNITNKVERADALEKQLAEGQTVIELDTDLIDRSFISDRLNIDTKQLDELVAQIRENGQLVPILVRPSPLAPERFQVAFGHRRLAAARQLGLKIRAVVKALTDEQLVVNQGQENNARANLSFIERAVFAARLEDRGFSRDIAMAALGVDKAAISKMLSAARTIGHELIEAIGSAPEVGRRRWLDLADQLKDGQATAIIRELSADNFASLTSEERFQYAADFVKKQQSLGKSAAQSVKQTEKYWSSSDQSVEYKMNRKSKKIAIELSNTNALAFGDWLTNQLDRLYDEYQTSEERKTGE